ncbi:dense granular protein gra10, partial [Cystoisospora suis]
MILYYRLSSEHAGSYRQCPLGCSALSLSEVKQLLSERCDLAREYRRKIDFRIFLVGGGSSGRGGPKNDGGAGGEDLTEVTDENQMIHAYSKLVVQRIAIIGSHPGNVLHKAKSELSQEEWKSSEERKWLNQRKKKKRLPPEWLCGICHHVMEQPVLIRCSGNCVQSACASCLESRLKNGSGACPFCKSKIVRQAIRNKRLEEIIRHANLSEYEEGAQLGEDR